MSKEIADFLAGFSTPTLNGNFTLEKSLPVIIFSYEPTGTLQASAASLTYPYGLRFALVSWSLFLCRRILEVHVDIRQLCPSIHTGGALQCALPLHIVWL